jgi:hypothetical protein
MVGRHFLMSIVFLERHSVMPRRCYAGMHEPEYKTAIIDSVPG